MITQTELKQVLQYDADTGVFTWRINKSNAKKSSSRAGCVDAQGYIMIQINGKSYLAHRLAWLYVTGALPSKGIDHANGIKADNKFANLREATPSENQFNVGLRSTNKSGFKGVSFNRSANKWQASITVNRKLIYLGLHKTPELAACAYSTFASEAHKQFLHNTISSLLLKG